MATLKQAIKAVEKAQKKPSVPDDDQPRAVKLPAGFKIPKVLGACVDLLYTTRNKRLEMQRDTDALEAQEIALKNHLINTLPKSESNGVAGKLARVSIEKKEIPRAEDWSKIYAQIVKQYTVEIKNKTGQQDGAFALLNRALNASAVTEVWSNKKEVPGVVKFTAIKVGINKIS